MNTKRSQSFNSTLSISIWFSCVSCILPQVVYVFSHNVYFYILSQVLNLLAFIVLRSHNDYEVEPEFEYLNAIFRPYSIRNRNFEYYAMHNCSVNFIMYI